MELLLVFSGLAVIIILPFFESFFVLMLKGFVSYQINITMYKFRNLSFYLLAILLFLGA